MTHLSPITFVGATLDSVLGLFLVNCICIDTHFYIIFITIFQHFQERWIRSKYEHKEFLPPCNSTMPLGQQLIDSVCSSNIKAIIHVLALANTHQVNTTVGPRDLRTPLHLACTMGNLAVAQLLIWVSVFF